MMVIGDASFGRHSKRSPSQCYHPMEQGHSMPIDICKHYGRFMPRREVVVLMGFLIGQSP